MKHIIGPIMVLLSGILFSTFTMAQTDDPPMIKSQSGIALESDIDLSMCSTDGVSVGGLDLVSYREQGGPVPGSEDFSTQHNGSTYLFKTQSNLDTFRADPGQYLPEYAGFCAITMALGRVTCPEYTNFKIEDGRLLLFEITGFTNGRTLWNSNPEYFRSSADSNFEVLSHRQ